MGLGNFQEKTLSDSVKTMLADAQERARQRGVRYRGDITPQEAWAVAQSDSSAVLVDIRSMAECDLVGGVPGALEIEFREYPNWNLNPSFMAEVRALLKPEQTILLLCRSSVRTVEAGEMLADAGYEHVYNVLEGFEGALNAEGKRAVNGWKLAGLPWRQG